MGFALNARLHCLSRLSLLLGIYIQMFSYGLCMSLKVITWRCPPRYLPLRMLITNASSNKLNSPTTIKSSTISVMVKFDVILKMPRGR